MKAGLFTFHYACNFGAALQCLALYRAVRGLGAEADVIGYVPPGWRPYPSWLRGWGIRRGEMLRNLPNKRIAARHGPGSLRAFERFRRRHLTFSAPCSRPEEIARAVSGYDALITGSDQVWHFSAPSPYFLEWGRPFAGRRISYAACCGHRSPPRDRVPEIRRWLGRFDSLSVRNGFSRELIEPLAGRPVAVVADPVLLADLDDVRQAAEPPCAEYILAYTLGPEIPGGTAGALRAIRRVAGDLPVVAVVASAHRPHPVPWADHGIWEAGPGEWLDLLARSRFVYTDSFHGALFSLLYRRPFLAYHAEEGRSPRLEDLALRYGLGAPAPWGGIEARTVYCDAAGQEDALRRIRRHAADSLSYLGGALAPDRAKA